MSTDIKTGILDELLGYHLRRAQSMVFDDFMRTMADDKISPGQFGVLTLIDANEGMNQSTLAEAIGIERSTMVAVITALETRLLIRRTPAPTDKRANVLSLTQDGRDLLAKIRPNVVAHEKSIFRDLSARERKSLTELLRKITD